MFRSYRMPLGAILLILSFSAHAVAEMSGDARRRACEFAQERDRAGEAYLKGWLKGDPPEALATHGAVLAAREAAIVALSNGHGVPKRCRAIFLGKRFEPEMVPAILIEAWGTTLSPANLFAGQTFIVDTANQ